MDPRFQISYILNNSAHDNNTSISKETPSIPSIVVLDSSITDSTTPEKSTDNLPSLSHELEDLLTPTADDHLCRLPSNPPRRTTRDGTKGPLVPALPHVIEVPVRRKIRDLDHSMPWQPSEPTDSALYKAREAHAAAYPARLEKYETEKAADTLARLRQRKGARESSLTPQKQLIATPKAYLDRLMACRGLKRKDVELEDIFDEPDAPIGIFDRNEVDYCVERERKVIVEDFRAAGMGEDVIEKVMVDCTGLSSSELEEKGERARQQLVAAGKLAPARRVGPATKSRPQRRRRTPYWRS